MIEKLAKISKAMLEIKEHGILNFWIFVDYEEGGTQGIGGFALDTYNEEKKCREGTAYGCELIRQLLLTLNVNDFAEMKGHIIWVLGHGKGLSFSPIGIKPLNINSEKKSPLIFNDILETFKTEKEK